mgnify:CR=1 FL=1
MLSAVDRAHLLPLCELDLLAVLSSLKPVQEVVSKRLVEVETQARSDFCCEAGSNEVSWVKEERANGRTGDGPQSRS